MNIPVVLVESGLNFLPETCRFLGELFGKTERGEEQDGLHTDPFGRGRLALSTCPAQSKSFCGFP